MRNVLLVDFGSTYTKVTAVDLEAEKLLGHAQSWTTVDTDINEGLEKAVAKLEEITGKLEYEAAYACSSAAGGLRMLVSGLVPALTAEAARRASLGAGAKIVKTYSYGLTEEDAQDIVAQQPDIFCPDHLVLMPDATGRLCVFQNKYGDALALVSELETDVSTLPAALQEELAEGIGFPNAEELDKWLESAES